MLTGFDSAAGSVIGACLNDGAAVHPTLSLAQRLWDDPVQLLTEAESGHRLQRHGLIEPGDRAGRETVVNWREPLVAPALVVRQLLFPAAGRPALLAALDRPASAAAGDARLGPVDRDRLRIVPVVGPRGAEHAAAALTAGGARREVEIYDGSPEGARHDPGCSRRWPATAGCAA